MTGIDIVKEEAEGLGMQLTKEQIDFVLWEQTGFPCYFMLDEEHPTPEARLRQQVRDFLRGARARVKKAKR